MDLVIAQQLKAQLCHTREVRLLQLCAILRDMSEMAPVTVDEKLRATIVSQDWQALRDPLVELPPSDVADLVKALPAEEEAFVFRILPKDEAGEVFSYLPADHQEDLIASLPNEQAGPVPGP